jgi:hypothetical protein
MSSKRRGWCLIAAGVALVLGASPALANGLLKGSCGSSCGKVPCPPYFKWYAEGAPKICFKNACPRPICEPCSLEHYGYYQTCWRPWSYPADWSHCPTPPPGAMLPPPAYPPHAPRTVIDPRRPHGEYELPAPVPAPHNVPAPPRNNANERAPSVRILP